MEVTPVKLGSGRRPSRSIQRRVARRSQRGGVRSPLSVGVGVGKVGFAPYRNSIKISPLAWVSFPAAAAKSGVIA